MLTPEKELKNKAINYLKDVYREDTVSMVVKKNGVEEGNGVMAVECTVKISGEKSDWYKEFTFKNGKVTNMTWQMR
ncbi:MAG: hypothetical protein WCI43_06675 [Candidatus Firestonebacteria bacterium]